MEEQGISRSHLGINQLEDFHCSIGAFRVSTILVTIAAMLNSAHEMGAFEQLHATILARVWIDRDEYRSHIRKQAAVLIPVAVILVPRPGSSSERFLDAHLGVVMIDFVSKQLF